MKRIVTSISTPNSAPPNMNDQPTVGRIKCLACQVLVFFDRPRHLFGVHVPDISNQNDNKTDIKTRMNHLPGMKLQLGNSIDLSGESFIAPAPGS